MKHTFCTLLLFASLLSLAADAPSYLFYPGSQAVPVDTIPAERTPASHLRIIAPQGEAPVALLSSEQKFFLDLQPRADRMAVFANAQMRVRMREATYQPMEVELKWDYVYDAYYNACSFYIYVSENADMSNAMRAAVPLRRTSLILNNLKLGTTYYWMIAVERVENDFVYSPVCKFTTENHAPRLLYIPGVPNARDLGGRIGLNGQRVRQGLVYRTAGLNDNASTVYKPVEDVKKDYPILVDIEKLIKAETASLKAEQASGKQLDYVDSPLSDEWTAFLPDLQTTDRTQNYTFLMLKETPTEYLGAKPQKVRRDSNQHIMFPNPVSYKPSFLIQEFDSDKDCAVRLGIGADWYWALYINDSPVYDCLQRGNNSGVITANDHLVDLKIRKGHNVVKLVLLSGSLSWCVAYQNGGPHHHRVNGLGMELSYLRDMERTLFRIPNGMKAGGIRLNSVYRSYVADTLGVRSDIDLRSDGECYGMKGSPAGDKVKWFHISSSCYNGMSTPQGRESFAKVFKVFLEKQNYPIVFHCIAGQDRTGAVAFIINALLGVEEEELYLDWEATGFWNPYVGFSHAKFFNLLVKVFDDYPGKTINERVEQYVLSLGFSQEDIAKLRTIMLEPAAKK